jgi:hypothetical protein
MTIFQLLEKYQRDVKLLGKKRATKNLWDMGYNRTLSMLIPMLFGEAGEPKELPFDPEKRQHPHE